MASFHADVTCRISESGYGTCLRQPRLTRELGYVACLIANKEFRLLTFISLSDALYPLLYC